MTKKKKKVRHALIPFAFKASVFISSLLRAEIWNYRIGEVGESVFRKTFLGIEQKRKE